MADTNYVWITIAVMAGVTFALRALPFVAGRWLRRQGLVHKLGATLPLSVMTLLLLHAMVGAARDNPAGVWQEGVAILLVLVLQWRTRNTLLSIVVGTAAYLLMRNL
ncbi:branched-chain amino acid transporter permease [Pusillimonas minor]|uniref:AzlD domain-containing protein n=1 Tax=Pusillimonas minor TaxID=2697024 RepID=A0A842HKR8_9BURK|nr:AzlD domain-containing protein [Pusillimonas minor]MBC2768362.1 AzlD domain-containing protein [Pusillimonas minor]